MTEAVTALGYTVSIEEALPATFDSAGFLLLTFDAIDGVTSVDGDLGYTFNMQSTSTLKDGVTKNAKGSKTFSPLTIQVLSNVTSTGGTALATMAAAQRTECSLKFEDVDGNIAYLAGIVTTDTTAVGNADNIRMKSFIFQPNYEPVYA